MTSPVRRPSRARSMTSLHPNIFPPPLGLELTGRITPVVSYDDRAHRPGGEPRRASRTVRLAQCAIPSDGDSSQDDAGDCVGKQAAVRLLHTLAQRPLYGGVGGPVHRLAECLGVAWVSDHAVDAVE